MNIGKVILQAGDSQKAHMVYVLKTRIEAMSRGQKVVS